MPKKYKARQNSKVKINSLMDEWLAGKNHKFVSGQVVCSKKDPEYIGVIQYALNPLETYKIKWHSGKNPWDYIEGTTTCNDIVLKPNVENPFKYKWSQRVPGPSSDAIDKLEEAFAAKQKARTPEEVEEYVASLEEDMHKRKNLEKQLDETKADSIVDETLDEDVELPIDPENLNKKIMDIIEE
jgi:hypothetical protein